MSAWDFSRQGDEHPIDEISFFSLLDRDTVEELYELYKYDFILFGYNASYDGYLRIAK